MKIHFIATIVLISAGISPAGEPPLLPHPAPSEESEKPSREKEMVAWLGLRLGKLDEATTAHLPDLPPGVGFVVKSVDENGPAETAAVRSLDVIWKFDDQILVNEGQLATLLRLKRPGDEVRLAVFRGGKPLDVALTLGAAPAGKGRFPGDMSENGRYSPDSGPMRVVNITERSATHESDEGKAVLRKEGKGYLLIIHDQGGGLIHEGSLPSDGDLTSVPKDWRRRVCALRRGLDHSIEGRIVPVRPPRPRVVPPPAP